MGTYVGDCGRRVYEANTFWFTTWYEARPCIKQPFTIFEADLEFGSVDVLLEANPKLVMYSKAFNACFWPVVLTILAYIYVHYDGVVVYKSRSSEFKHSSDLRFDTMSLSDLKHNANYHNVSFDYSRRGMWGWKLWKSCSDTFMVSTELLVQLCAPTVFDLAHTPEEAWDRIRHAAKTFCSVNSSRYLILKNENVSYQTCVVAFAAYQDGRRRRTSHPVPGMPPPM